MDQPLKQYGPVYTFDGMAPTLGDNVFIAPTAAVIGHVTVGADTSIWFGAVIRGDDMPVIIGRGTNVQDGAVIHGTEHVSGTVIGDDVVVGHGAILHGCEVANGAMIGMGAIILDGAVIGERAVVAAGAVVPPGKSIPAHGLWVGGSVKRETNAAERSFLDYAPRHYRARALQYAQQGFAADGCT